MIIKILGTGAETTKPPKPYLGKYKPSCLIISPPVTILIDVGKDILEKVTKEELLDVTHVLLIHAHSDSIDGIPTFNKFLEENNKTVELYALPQVFERIKLRWTEKSYSNYLFVPISTKKPFKIVDHTIKAVKVFHDPRFPTVAYNFDNIFFYGSDMGPIFDEYDLKYFSNNVLAIIDGAYWDNQIALNNHIAVLEHIDFILSLNNKYTLFTGMGNQWPRFDEANKILKEKLEEYKKEHPDCKVVEIRTAKEGEKLMIDLNKLYSQRNELLLKPGFDTILNNPDILRRIPKKELLMVHLRCHQLWAIKKTNKVLQVHVLVVKEMFRRGLKHRVINDLDRKTYRILGREIKVYEIWEELQDEIVIKSNVVKFVGSSLRKSDPNDLDVIAPEAIYKIIKQFLKKYNPHYIGNDVSHGDVLNVYDLVLKKKESPNIVNPRLPDYTKTYSTCKRVSKLNLKSDTYVVEPLIDGNFELVVDRKNRIIYERVVTNSKEIVTDLLAYKSDNLFNEILINRLVFMHKKWLDPSDHHFYLPIRWIVKKDKLWKFLNTIKSKYDAVIIRPATSKYYDGKFILYFKKKQFCCECLECGYRMQSDKHCRDIRCPRCNGEMRRCDRPGIGKSIQKDKELKPLIKFPPLKATASSYHELEYFDPEEAWEYFCKFYVEQEGKVRAEFKVDGWRIILSQNDNKKSLIYFEDAMRDVSSKLPSLVKELSTLHDSGIILDGELMEWDPNKNRWLSRHDLMKWSQAKKPGSDENVRVFVFDILYYNGTDLHNKPLSERLKVLKEVSKKFKKHFILCPGFDIKTKEQLVKKFNYLKHHLGAYRLGGLNGIDGLMIKAYSGVYELDGKTMTWIKLKYSYEADVIVLEVHKVKNKNVYNYTVGYGIPQDKKDLFTPIKELNGKWYGVLGRTFNTKIKAKVGQILNIAATEYKKERVNGKIKYTLFQARIITLKPDKKEPDSYLVIDRMSVEKAQSFYEALLKADDLGQITSPHGDPLPWPVSTEPLKPPKEKPKHVYRCEECGYTIESDEKLPKDLRCPICGGKLKEVKTKKDCTIYIVKKRPATGQWTIEEGMTGQYGIQCHTRGVRIELVDYITKSDMKKFGLDRDYFLDNEKIEKIKKYYDFPWKSAIKEASQEGKSSKKLTKLIDKVLEDEEKFSSLPKEIKHIIALLDPVSIHQDLRLVPYVDPKKKKLASYFEGGHWTTPGNQFKENKLLRIDEHIHLQFMLKTPHVDEYTGQSKEPIIRGPSSWIYIGAKEPFIVPPNSIGSTPNAYAFFWRHDHGEWFAGRQTSPHGRHFKLFKFKGNLLNGWIVFMYAPIGGKRIWLCYKPKENKQREYEEHYFGNKSVDIDALLLEDAEIVYKALYKYLHFKY